MTLSVVLALTAATALQTALLRSGTMSDFKISLVLTVLSLFTFVLLLFNEPLLFLASTKIGFLEWVIGTSLQGQAYLWIPFAGLFIYKKLLKDRTFFGIIQIL